MAVLDVDGYRFYEMYVCWHFERDNVFSPWRTIGLVASTPDWQGCWYLTEYRKVWGAIHGAEYAKVDSPYLKASYEVLDLYRKRYQTLLNVISPPIVWYTQSTGDYYHKCKFLYKQYVLGNSLNKWRRLALMLRMKDKYFECVSSRVKHNDEPTRALFKAGIL